ncbi:hypothetical protein OHC33_006861 [Knufia fluminis]|uniref:N-acetyltransferase domain-containing protein n=1 Tax=Knufia fluminis TaxID=191047 RepID=A0AAN8EL30_9EURO|nr:hypothetical protein OHC33_006861 [Knufia fluminis]
MAQLLNLTIALLMLCQQAWPFPPEQQQQWLPQQTYLADSNIHIRPATETDLDDIVTVFVDAFAPGPVWRYLYQFQDQYKEYQWDCMREDIGKQFKHIPNNTFANVISVPSQRSDPDTQGSRDERVVAIAVWKIFEPSSEHPDHGNMDLLSILPNNAQCSDHLDMNLTRAADYEGQFSAAMQHYVYDLPQRQMYLTLLATHPDWDGHDFGARHVHWGMEMAREMGVPTTLLGTPAGWPLYDSLGFESVANVTIETLGEMEGLWYEYMRYDASVGR